MNNSDTVSANDSQQSQFRLILLEEAGGHAGWSRCCLQVNTRWAIMKARNWQSADWFEENDSMGGEFSVPLNLGQK